MPPVEKSKYIWMNGSLVPWDEANVHVLAHTLHYGYGVFEGTRAYCQADGSCAVFRLDDHLERLMNSAKIMALDLPFDTETLRDATLQLISENEMESCYIRHLAIIDSGVMGLHPQDNPITVVISAWPWGAYLGPEALARGVRCRISSYSRHFPNSALVRAKAVGNYINSILAKREAVGLGYDEAILLDTQGYVTEGSGENLFMVRRGKVRTPQPGSILEGITRDTIFQLASEEGLEVEEGRLTRDELYVADELFLTGTAAEITPINSVDDRSIGTGRPGPITQALQDRFLRTVRGELEQWRHWLEPVPRRGVEAQEPELKLA